MRNVPYDDQIEMMTRKHDATDTNSTKTRDMKGWLLMKKRNEEKILYRSSIEYIVYHMSVLFLVIVEK